MIRHAAVAETSVIQDEHEQEQEAEEPERITPRLPYKRRIVWHYTLYLLLVHLGTLYGLCYLVFRAKILTILWTVFWFLAVCQGVTMGAHRLYAHRAYKAKPLLRMVLVMLHTMAGQHRLWTWARDHRIHHKYVDTDADPHNASRGFFFSHVGWIMVEEHPEFLAKTNSVDMTDIETDPFVMFQKRFYWPMYLILAVVMPTAVPCWLWAETPLIAFVLGYLVRTAMNWHSTFMINSYAHMYGTRPYTRDILPTQTRLVSVVAMGEGWHNYHHSFPWDYRASELGEKTNLTTSLLDLFASWGWVYDLKTASPSLVQQRILRKGDGSHPLSDHTTRKL